MGGEAKKEGQQTPEEPKTVELPDDQLTGVSGGRALHPVNVQRPVKFTGPTLSGKGTDVAMEELVLSKEKLTLD